MEISVPFSMVVVSKRNSGKSYLTKHLLKMFMVDNKLFDYIVLFSSTAHLTKDFDCLPKKSIQEDFLKSLLHFTVGKKKKQTLINNIQAILNLQIAILKSHGPESYFPPIFKNLKANLIYFIGKF